MNKKIIISKLEEVLKAQLIIGNEEIRVLSLTVSDSLVNLKKREKGGGVFCHLYFWLRYVVIALGFKNVI